MAGPWCRRSASTGQCHRSRPPADIIDKYPQFYWNMISPHVEGAIRYLNVTARGRQWIANLYSNVFRAERDVRLSGPQP